MENNNRSLLNEDRLEENPAVDSRVVREAQRARKELESLGVWEESGSRVRSPFEFNPDLSPYLQAVSSSTPFRQELLNER